MTLRMPQRPHTAADPSADADGAERHARPSHSAFVRKASARAREYAGASLTASGIRASRSARPRSRSRSRSRSRHRSHKHSPQYAGSYIFPDPDDLARRQLRFDKYRMYQLDERNQHHHPHEHLEPTSTKKMSSQQSAKSKPFPKIGFSKMTMSGYDPELLGNDHMHDRDCNCDECRLDDDSDAIIDSQRLFDLTIEFLEKHGLNDSLLFAKSKGNVDTCLEVRSGENKIAAARIGELSGDSDLAAVAEASKTNASEPVNTSSVGADVKSTNPTVTQSAPQGYQLYVPADSTSGGLDRAARRSVGTAIKFADTLPSREWLHDSFMRFVTSCLIKRDGQSRSSSRSPSASNRNENGDRRSKGPNDAGRYSSGSASSGTERQPGNGDGRKSRSRTARSRGRSARSMHSSASSAVRPGTAKILIQNRIYTPHVMDLHEADLVRDFLTSTAPFCETRKARPKTLADWHLDNHGKAPIWDSRAFSVKRYIMVYLKSQAAVEEALRKRQKAAAAASTVGSGAASIQKRVSSSGASATGGDTSAAPAISGANLNTSYGRQRRINMAGSDLNLSAQLRDMFFAKHPETIGPLRKTAFERTPDDIKAIFRAMRGIKAFKDLSDFILGQVCGVLKYQEYEGNRAVFRQGDVGTAWYIILSGSCSVQISKTGRIEDSFAVATLGAGSGFGDLALVNDKPRAATILTLSHCELVSVEKADYNRIIKFIHEKDMKEKVYFLRKVPMFSEWSATQLRQIGQVMTWRKHAAGATLQTEGQAVNEFVIIKSGECLVYQELKDTRSGGRSFKIRIGSLGPLEYFGEEGVLLDDARKSGDGDASAGTKSAPAASGTGAATAPGASTAQGQGEQAWPAKSTIVAGKSGAEVAVITCFDARTKFGNNLTMNPIHDKTSADLVLIYRADLRRRAWDREKRAVIDGMVKERLRDPTMNASKLMAKNEGGFKPWHF